MRHSQIWENRFLENSCLATIERKCCFCVLAEASLKKKKRKGWGGGEFCCALLRARSATLQNRDSGTPDPDGNCFSAPVASRRPPSPPPPLAGLNQFNHMALPNAQMSQAPMGARAASPMNHPQQMNLSSVPAVRRRRGEGHFKKKTKNNET